MLKANAANSKRESANLQEEELIHRAIEALLNALGPIETARFLTLPHTPRLDSVLRHQVWQGSLN